MNPLTPWNFIRLKINWIHSHLGYTIPAMTLSDHARFDVSPMGRQHKENYKQLEEEFDRKMLDKWNDLVADVEALPSDIGPFAPLEEWVKPEKQIQQDMKAADKAFRRAFCVNPRRRR